MTAEADLALAATLHDPSGALLGLLERALPMLRRAYRVLAVATSPPTAERMVRALQKAGIHAGTPRANRRGPLYRRALRAALSEGTARVHYLDFDRALHWAAVAPGELGTVTQLGSAHAPLWIGRTRRAHATHHRPLVATEEVVNSLFARRLGLRERADFLVPSFVVDRETAAALLGQARAEGGAIYGELVAWFAILCPRAAYLECRGLEWETPDRFPEVVDRLGLAEWRRRQDTPREWVQRVELAVQILRGFERVIARHPALAVHLCPLPLPRPR